MLMSLLCTFPSVGYHQRRMMGHIDLQRVSNSGTVCRFLVQIQGGGAQSLVVIRPGVGSIILTGIWRGVSNNIICTSFPDGQQR